jgi:hypothetical protein
MPNSQLQQRLITLLGTTDSLLTLNSQQRNQMQESILRLPEGKLLEVIAILEGEQQRVANIKQNLNNYIAELQVLTQKVNVATSQLSRVYAGVKEEAEQKEDLLTGEELLREVDSI